MELIVGVTAGGPKAHHPAACSVLRRVAAIEGASLHCPQHDPPCVGAATPSWAERCRPGRPTAAAVLTGRSARLVAALHAKEPSLPECCFVRSGGRETRRVVSYFESLPRKHPAIGPREVPRDCCHKAARSTSIDGWSHSSLGPLSRLRSPEL